MQLNQATDYAFRVILHLAAKPAGEVVSGQIIAAEENIPPLFLQKITRALGAAGLVRSFRGVDGGFALIPKAEEITLLRVIEAMEGPLAIHGCLGERGICNRHCQELCPVHEALHGVQAVVASQLGGVNFRMLADQWQERKQGK